MMTQKFSININKDVKKTLGHIAIDKETTSTKIVTTLIKNFIKLNDKTNNLDDCISNPEIYELHDENDSVNSEKSSLTMNLDKEIKKSLKHIATDKETTSTKIITSLIKNFIELNEKTKKDNDECRNDAPFYKHFNENDIEIYEDNISVKGTIFSKNMIADTFNELTFVKNFFEEQFPE